MFNNNSALRLIAATFAVCLLALVVASPRDAVAQAAAPQLQQPSAADWVDLAARSTRVVPNLVYRRANNTDLKLDVYAPRNSTHPVPVVISIHGGGWVVGDKESGVLSLLPYLEMGFAAVNVEYRLAENSPAPAAVEDCRCALHWVVNNAAEYGFDLDRVVVTGSSAGGHLALTTGLLTPEAGFDRGCTAPQKLRWETADTTRPKVAGIINWFGITDVAEMFAGPNAKNYAIEWFGSMPERDKVAQQISPVNLVRKDSPPVLTVHGDKDTLVPYRAVAPGAGACRRAQSAHHHSQWRARRLSRRRGTAGAPRHSRISESQSDRALS